MTVAMLVDTTVCTGCRGCQVACKQWWDLPAEKTENRGSHENPPDLSASTWTRVTFHEVEQGEDVRWFHMAWGCVHCTDAGCVAVCPTGALARDAKLGIVTLDRARCNGCGYCVEACPFGVPRLEASLLTGRGKATKCNFCQDRITNDLLPACVKTCPTGAIRFGERSDMVALGQKRVERLKQDGLDQARLYGDTELGGLGRMFVLGAPAAAYRLPEAPKVSRTIGLWQKAVQPLGKIAVVGTVVGLAVNWFVNFRSRRNGKVAPEQTEER
jgi:formate dehydrogenase beta subunit